jgi:hypothetical protein
MISMVPAELNTATAPVCVINETFMHATVYCLDTQYDAVTHKQVGHTFTSMIYYSVHMRPAGGEQHSIQAVCRTTAASVWLPQAEHRHCAAHPSAPLATCALAHK